MHEAGRRHVPLLWLAGLVVAIVGALFPGIAARSAAEAGCTSNDLTILVRVQNSSGDLAGAIFLTNHAAASCVFSGFSGLQLTDGRANSIPVTLTAAPGQPLLPARAVDLQPGQQAVIAITWANYCQQPAPPPPYGMEISFVGDGQAGVLLTGAPGFFPIGTPPTCHDAGAPSTLTASMGPPLAPPPPAADPRYFSQTGFRVDNDAIWDYFNHRGGVTTFGYPVSRTFRLQGFLVQFFQRRVVQLDQQGHARLLNLLDAGLLPYSSFNGAAFPSVDAGLVASAPSPADPMGTMAFVRAHTPDAWNGRSVNFLQTYFATVPYSVAFPNGGDAALLPGIDLELWGIPTSAPQFDPNNHNFVYLRFQRGIMHFDAGCNCTQGILLADYLKAILIGTSLPADLSQEAQGSVFYKQYDPTQPGWVHNPGLLPNTDLTNAFSSGA